MAGYTKFRVLICPFIIGKHKAHKKSYKIQQVFVFLRASVLYTTQSLISVFHVPIDEEKQDRDFLALGQKAKIPAREDTYYASCVKNMHLNLRTIN